MKYDWKMMAGLFVLITLAIIVGSYAVEKMYAPTPSNPSNVGGDGRIPVNTDDGMAQNGYPT